MTAIEEGGSEVLSGQGRVADGRLSFDVLDEPFIELTDVIHEALSDPDRREALAMAMAGLRHTTRTVREFVDSQALRTEVARQAADPSSDLGAKVKEQVEAIMEIHARTDFKESLAKAVRSRLIAEEVAARQLGADAG